MIEELLRKANSQAATPKDKHRAIVIASIAAIGLFLVVPLLCLLAYFLLR